MTRAAAFACSSWARRTQRLQADRQDLLGADERDAADCPWFRLCADCHRQAPCAYHRIGKRAFEERHGLRFAAVVDRLQRERREQKVA